MTFTNGTHLPSMNSQQTSHVPPLWAYQVASTFKLHGQIAALYQDFSVFIQFITAAAKAMAGENQSPPVNPYISAPYQTMPQPQPSKEPTTATHVSGKAGVLVEQRVSSQSTDDGRTPTLKLDLHEVIEQDTPLKTSPPSKGKT